MYRYFILIFLFPISIFAQNSNVDFGIKGGFNFAKHISSLSTNNLERYKPGYDVGGFVNFNINDKLSLQSELLFSSQGARLKADNVSVFNASGTVNFGQVDASIKIIEKK